MPSLSVTPANLCIGVALLALSPVLMLSLPFWILPALLAYLAYYLFYPVTPKKSPQRSVAVSDKQPNEGRPRRWIAHPKIERCWDSSIETLPALMTHSVEKFGSRRALGHRRTLKVEEKEVKQEVDGKIVTKKYKIPWQSEYEWRTYIQLGDEIARFGSGLVAQGLEFGQRVALFAATRPEWQVAAHACFKHGLPVVTIYPSLGVDALVYSLNQASIQYIVTQADKLDIVIEAASLVSSLKYVIFFDEIDAKRRSELESKSRLKFVSYAQLLIAGVSNMRAPTREPKGKDVAVIMYTSGSTGNPKGVLISHSNLLTASWSVTYVPPEPLNKDDVYVGYLPLAHVLELAAETLFLGIGASIGYSSPLTLQDSGAKDANGQPMGDLTLLKPTIMAAVPLILDRFRSGVMAQINKSNIIVRALFRSAYYLKERNYLRKHASPLLDRLVFDKIKAKIGGRVRLLLSGGAPLSQDTQRFINVVFCVPVLQGYGLTETLAANCVTHPDDVQTGNVGAPIPSCEIKLVDVPEMGYKHDNKDERGHPKEQGEIAIRGGCISAGYFDLPDQTAEVFKKPTKNSSNGHNNSDADDLPWFYTGDIGQWRDDGTLMIIDRKKDLVKLSHGEYIALGNLESIYSHSPLVQNICIYADADHQRPIAIIVPHVDKVKAIASSKGITDVQFSLNSPAVKRAVTDDLAHYAQQKKLEKWERVANIYLTDDEWSSATGMLTEAMKLKRHEIKKKYKQQIEDTYKGVD